MIDRSNDPAARNVAVELRMQATTRRRVATTVAAVASEEWAILIDVTQPNDFDPEVLAASWAGTSTSGIELVPDHCARGRLARKDPPDYKARRVAGSAPSRLSLP